MKITLVLSLALVMGTCDQKTAPSAAQTGQVRTTSGNGMDSPIIISDGSPEAHLRHKGSAAADFEVISSGSNAVVQVSDATFTATSIECLNMSGCAQTNLTSPWTLDVLDASSNSVMTLSSNDNVTIPADFHANGIVVGKDKKDTAGSDLNAKGLVFHSATFTNGGSGAVTFTCSGTSPCKICIHYKSDAGAGDSKLCKP